MVGEAPDLLDAVGDRNAGAVISAVVLLTVAADGESCGADDAVIVAEDDDTETLDAVRNVGAVTSVVAEVTLDDAAEKNVGAATTVLAALVEDAAGVPMLVGADTSTVAVETLAAVAAIRVGAVASSDVLLTLEAAGAPIRVGAVTSAVVLPTVAAAGDPMLVGAVTATLAVDTVVAAGLPIDAGPGANMVLLVAVTDTAVAARTAEAVTSTLAAATLAAVGEPRSCEMEAGAAGGNVARSTSSTAFAWLLLTHREPVVNSAPRRGIQPAFVRPSSKASSPVRTGHSRLIAAGPGGVQSVLSSR